MLVAMMMSIVIHQTQAPAADAWVEFESWAGSTSLSVEDLAAARQSRQRAFHGKPEQDPDPWYVMVRRRDDAGVVHREGYICGRGHVDDENGINPILPHTVAGEIYDRVCVGEGEAVPTDAS